MNEKAELLISLPVYILPIDMISCVSKYLIETEMPYSITLNTHYFSYVQRVLGLNNSDNYYLISLPTTRCWRVFHGNANLPGINGELHLAKQWVCSLNDWLFCHFLRYHYYASLIARAVGLFTVLSWCALFIHVGQI